MGISEIRLQELMTLLAAGKEHEFYYWQEWKRVRKNVLLLDNYECQRCKREKGKYSKATIVHHIKHLKDRPDLALSIWEPSTGQRQLESVCKACHEELHPGSQRQFKMVCAPLTEERWD